MALRLSLVIDGNTDGSKKALDDTRQGIEALDRTAGTASVKVEKIGKDLDEVATSAGEVATEVPRIGTAAETAGAKFDGFKLAALGAIGGIASGIVAAGIEALFNSIAGAAKDMVDDIMSAQPQLDRALEGHAALVRDIKAAYAEAEGAASSYGNNSRALLEFQARQNLRQLSEADQRLQGETLRGTGWQQLLEIGGGSGLSSPRLRQELAGTPFAGVVEDFNVQLREGTADAIAFKNAIAEIANTLPDTDRANLDLAARLSEQVDALADTQQKLAGARDLLEATRGNAEAAATALGGTAEEYAALGEYAGAALPNLIAVNDVLGSIGTRGALAQSQAVLPLGGFSVGGGFETGGWTGGLRGQVRGVVHGEEYVVRAGPAARHFGLLEAINNEGSVPGYATGGYVGPSPAGASGTYSVAAGLIEDFAGLRGAVAQLVQDLWRTRDPLQALGNVIQSVSQNFLNSAIGAVGQAAGNAVSGWVGNAVGSMFGGPQLQLGYQAGVYHRGGVVGAAPETRFAPAALFASAPRFHNGLGPDEFPAILERGETVIPRGGRAGGTVNIFNVSTPDPRAFAQSPSSVARGAARLARSSGRHS